MPLATRILASLLYGVLTFIVVFIVFALISAIIPGLSIDAVFWGGAAWYNCRNTPLHQGKSYHSLKQCMTLFTA